MTEADAIYSMKDTCDTFEVCALSTGEYQARVVFEDEEDGVLSFDPVKTVGAAMMQMIIQFMHDNQHAFEHTIDGQYVNNFEAVLEHVEKGAQIVQDLEADIKAHGLIVE